MAAARRGSEFKVALQMTNLDRFGKVSYLTAGEIHLPLLFLSFTLLYSLLSYVWKRVIHGEHIYKNERVTPKGKSGVRAIHQLMLALIVLKALCVFFEAARYYSISFYGHAEIWSFIYYSLTFVKGVMLFSVILLIGSGWSLVKPFLHDREKKVVLAVLVLQVLNNLALVALLYMTEGEKQFGNWTAILHLVDILCCCAVLLPLVWHVSSLENEEQTTESERTLKKLRKFRTFYLLVMTYIYFTRVIVYLVENVLSYRYTWVSSFLTELGTMAFFIATGYFFQPEPDDQVTLNMPDTKQINKDAAEYGEVEALTAEPITTSKDH